MQGQGLRDRAPRLAELGAVVLGASFDTIEANRAFAEAQGFEFSLLSDTTAGHPVGRAYEVTRPAGDRFADFPRRYAYLIGPDGTIRRSYDVTDVANHAAEVIGDLERLGAEGPPAGRAERHQP